MDIFLTGKSDAEDLVIDFIELKLKTGETVSLDWDQSYVDRGQGGRFEATYEGINIGGESARRKLSKFKGAAITEVGLYSESRGRANLDILEMTVAEGNRTLTFRAPYSVRGAEACG